MSKRAGETLIEVVVSFTIMSFVLAGISGLVTQLVGMITDARTITHATAFAQQGLTDGVAVSRTRCDVRTEPASIAQGEIIETGLVSPAPKNGVTLTVDMRWLATSEESAADGLTNTNGYRKVVSTASWTNSTGQSRSYILTQVVKR